MEHRRQGRSRRGSLGTAPRASEARSEALRAESGARALPERAPRASEARSEALRAESGARALPERAPRASEARSEALRAESGARALPERAPRASEARSEALRAESGARALPERAPRASEARSEALRAESGARALPERAPRAADLFPVALVRADVATVPRAAAALSALLSRPELADRIARLPASDALDRTLGSLVLIADSALTMLDYAKLGTGWDGFGLRGSSYPETHDGYRRRAYRPDFDRRSQPRREQSKVELGDAIAAALQKPDPVAALEETMVAELIAQLGIPPQVSAGWKPNAAAVSKALDDDLFIPLRALADATLCLDHRGHVPMKGFSGRQLDEMSHRVVEVITQHVVEGDFEEWRFTNEASRRQLECLSPEQLEAYRRPLSVERISRSGRKLTTRDEQGAGLMWVTKIGGPSHGFDMLSQCLLPLLANGRNGAIVVDEEGWPSAARSVIRLLPTPQGRPMLYLEMLQADFPHDLPGRSTVSRAELRAAIVEHAVEKARALGVPLVIAPSQTERSELFAQLLGVKAERRAVELVLHPSAGVFEASDSLLGAHHAPQLELEIARVPLSLSALRFEPVKPLVIQT